ncbi:two-component regulator propeller domain-containing protein [Arcticibacter sp. MXS-1]|uniref:ligand-binding sensor domain-containing protein n=1 Tax=Arcticibacter sp. MXS-1 TaxID=3341726 RepID=UPI0035A8658E
MIRKLNLKDNTIRSYDAFAHSPIPRSRNIPRIFDTGDRYLLVGTSNQGVKLFDKMTHAYEDLLSYNKQLSEIYVRDFLHYRGDEYWVATELGIFIYNLKTRKDTNLVKNVRDPYSLSDNAVYTLCKDREGGVWAGSFFGGLSYHPQQYTLFEKFFPTGTPGSISGTAVRKICKDAKGNIWIGTEDASLNRFDPKKLVFTTYAPSGNKSSVAYSNIHGLMAYQNELWIGTFEHGLDVMDLKTNKVIRHYQYGADSNSLKSNFITHICRTQRGSIYIGTTNGLYVYNRRSDNFTNVQFQRGYRPFVYAMTEDSKGNLWISSFTEGIYKIETGTGRISNFRYRKGKKNGLRNNRVNSIFEASDRSLWLATEGGGLFKFREADTTVETYSRRDGLPSNFVFGVLEDSKTNLWISTSKGLACLERRTKKFSTYTKSNGLLYDQFNYHSAFKDESTGDMYFGTIKGLIRFNPDEFRKNRYNPPVYITGFEVQNKELAIDPAGQSLKKSVVLTDTIRLAYNQSSFNINFAALTFNSPLTTHYAYRMNGLDESWTYLKRNRRAYFTGLRPGTYTFRVKAMSDHGVGYGKEAVLTIVIHPPLWRTPLAYLIYGVVLFAIGWLCVRTYVHRMKSRHQRKLELLTYKKEKEIYKAKIDFFTKVAHEIRTPLTLIRGPMEKVLKEADDLPLIRKSLLIMEKNTARLLDLTNQLLDFRKVETDSFSLNFSECNLNELMTDLHDQFKPVMDQQKISFRLSVPPIPVIVRTDADAVSKIVGNLLSNALKYGERQVVLSLQTDGIRENSVAIKVRSDGFIIPEAQREKIFEPFFRIKEVQKKPGSGIGLSLARSLAELLQGSLSLGDSEDGMNVFILTLPGNTESRAG